MLSLADEAKTFFSKLESDLSLSGQRVSETTRRYKIPWADSLSASLSRTRSSFSFFGVTFDYYIMLQAEKYAGSGQENYWKAQAKTWEFAWKGGLLGRGQASFKPSMSAQIAQKHFSMEDDSQRKGLSKDSDVKRLLSECDPVFCAALVYSEEIPDYPFSVGASVLDYPYEVSYKGQYFYNIVRLEKKEQGCILKRPGRCLELLRALASVVF